MLNCISALLETHTMAILMTNLNDQQNSLKVNIFRDCLMKRLML